jgi:predicted permease
MAGWVVAGEVAIAMVLLIACSLLFRTLYNVQHKPLGFDAGNLITFTATPPNSAGYLSGGQPGTSAKTSIATQVYEPILNRLRRLPGVQDAALTSSLPFDGVDMRTSFELNGAKETEEEKQARHAEIRVMSGDYMRVVRTPMVRGRAISDTDTGSHPYVAVVNQTFAREFLKGTDPIGQHIALGGKDTGMITPYTVIGVAADAVQKKVGAPPMPELMLSYQQIPQKSLFYPLLVASATKYTLRTAHHQELATPIHNVFRQMAPGFAIDDLQTMQQSVNASIFNQRLAFYLIGSFAGIAVLMVIIGLYGVLSQLVSQRRQEIGIRMAVGASREAILALILRQGSVLVTAGLIIGIVAALAASNLISSFLYGVSAADVWSYLAASAGLLAIAFAAALIPARRAAAVEPLEALRAE